MDKTEATTKKRRIITLDFTEKPVEEKPTRDRSIASAKRAQKQRETLTPRERKFCKEYVKTGKAGQSVMKAGYNCSNLNSAGVQATDLLKKPKIQAEIKRLEAPSEREAIATAQEVMERLTAIARGTEKDQFGLDISAADKLKALVELAKRTIDIDNKAKLAQATDNSIIIKLDWQPNADK